MLKTSLMSRARVPAAIAACSPASDGWLTATWLPGITSRNSGMREG